jgi:hypothetical protein
LQKIEEIGPRWTALARFFEGQTDFEVKAKWTNLYKDRRSDSFRLRFALRRSHFDSAVDSDALHSVPGDGGQPESKSESDIAPLESKETVDDRIWENHRFGEIFLDWDSFGRDSFEGEEDKVKNHDWWK